MSFKKVFRGYDPDEVDKYIAEASAKEQQIRTAQKERIDELSDENYALRQQVKQYQTDEQAISKSLIASQHLAQELKFDAERYSDLVLSRAKIFYATWRAYAKTLVASLSEEEVRAFNELRRKIENVINAYEGKDVEREMTEKAFDERTVAAAAQSQPEAQPIEPQIEPVVQQQQPEPQQSKPEPQPVEQHIQPEAHPVEPQIQPEPQPQLRNDEPLAAPAHSAPETVSEEEKWRQARAVVDVTPSEKTMHIYANPISKVQEASGQVIDLRELTKTDMSLEDLCAELGLIKKDD